MKGKKEKGITLVALIITISILLILAAVTIGTMSKDEMIPKIKNVKSDYEMTSEKQELKKAILEWSSTYIKGKSLSLKNYLSNIYGEGKVRELGSKIVVQLPSGTSYEVTEDGIVN